MTWFKIDDASPFHPKVIMAGNEAWGAFCRMGAHCSAHLTDGFVDQMTAETICTKKVLLRLVQCKLIDKSEDGYHVHDYLEYNPPAEKVKAERAAAKERMDRVRGAKRLPPSPPNNQNCSGEQTPNKRRTNAENMAKFALPDPTRIPPIGGGSGETPVAATESMFAMIQKILDEHPHWREPLEAKIKAKCKTDSLDNPNPYRLKILQGWLAGDGTPPEPVIASKCSLSDDWKAGDNVEVRPGVFAVASHDKDKRAPLDSLRFPGAEMSRAECREKKTVPSWNGRSVITSDGTTTTPVPGWVCLNGRQWYTIGDGGYDSPPRKCDIQGNLLPDDKIIPVTSGQGAIAQIGVLSC